MIQEETQSLLVLKDVALEVVKEQRRARRWGIFFKLLFVGMGLLLLIGINADESGNKFTDAEEITAVVDINGVIMDGALASGEFVNPALKEAFEHEKTKGVLLRINSPGGSPVQSGIINDEIKRLKAKHKEIPVYAVVSDLCASGGYYIAVAADKIYADKASIVGSIGVRMDNFGAVGLMEKLGVERRLYTAGANKGMLDPFLPENETQVAHIRTMLNNTHQQFISVVKEGRGERLQNNPDIFSGLFWTGEDALKLGLIDGFGSDAYVARELIKAEEMVNFTSEKDLFERLSERVETSAQALLSMDATPRPVLR